MHTQHVKSSAYVAWGSSGVDEVVAVGVVFEGGEVSGLEDDPEAGGFENSAFPKSVEGDKACPFGGSGPTCVGMPTVCW